MVRVGGGWRLEAADGTVVAEDCELARSHWRRFMGLMGRPELPAGQGLWLEPCGSIHMFFMRFPIDVAFLDRKGEVLRTYHGIRPWRTTRMVRRARVAVELPDGTLARLGLDRGTTLSLLPRRSTAAQAPADSGAAAVR